MYGHSRFVSLADGSIQFLHQGQPPTVVPGYEVDLGDPFLFHPILVPCAARTFKLIQTSCCPEGQKIRHCSKFNLVAMTAEQCNRCVEKNEHIPLVINNQ